MAPDICHKRRRKKVAEVLEMARKPILDPAACNKYHKTRDTNRCKENEFHETWLTGRWAHPLTLDVAAVVVLIGHDHQMPIPQALCVDVLVVELQTQDFHHVLRSLARRWVI